MSAVARRNGWRGFDGIGARVAGGYRYQCDGMPSMFGCGEEIVIPRRFARVGVKKTGWLVCYGRDLPGDLTNGKWGDDGKGNDLDVVLTYCPGCREVVEQQEAAG